MAGAGEPPQLRPTPTSTPRRERQVAFRVGISAESRAAALLIAKGFRILARRWKCPVGEIDIVARRRSLLVFVEVKARENLDDAAWSVSDRARQDHRRSRGLARRQSPRQNSGFPLRRHAGRTRPHSAPHPGSVRREPLTP